MSSIKKNFLYSAALTVSTFLFTFITFPYASRVLGVQNIGICNFVDSIVNYFILFSTLGITAIGIREIAKNRGNKKELEESFRDIIFLNAIFTIAALIILLFLIFFVKKLYSYKELMAIGIVKIIFTFFTIEWFYKGVENFRYITIRSLIIKVLYVISVFLFVKNVDDYILYYCLTTLAVVINAFFNWRYLKKLIEVKFKGFKLARYLKPVVTLGVYMILTSMYVNFNTTFLGFAGNEKEVGYYSTATKLYSILLALFSSFTGVMLPRMSSLIADGKFDEFKKITAKSNDILFGFSFPVVIISVIFAPQIIQIIAGAGYEGAILPMRIVMPLMLVIGYEQILVLQILMPMKKDSSILINSIIGAAVGVFLNIVLVPRYLSVGSAFTWVISEFVVLISAQYFATRYTGIRFPYKKLGMQIALAIPPAVICIFIYKFLNIHIVLLLLLSTLFVGIYYLIVQIKLLSNSLVIDVFNKIFKLKK
ncbi:MAG: flippase [Chitinophagaceae bacterium]|nr:flippase [Chitinophagaceae bacterium]